LNNFFINLNKKGGVTSQSAVTHLKYILKDKGFAVGRIGHLGTLDPLGEGVLPVAIDNANRLFPYFIEKRKVYYTIFEFGKETDTLDGSGVVTATSDAVVSKEDIERVLPKMLGEIEQMPPQYSRKSVGGVRAYELARRGEVAELTPKKVLIENIEVLEELGGNAFSLRVTCGGGTYIRSLVRDIAYALDTVGLMRYIKREQSGSFFIENSFTEEGIRAKSLEEFLVPVESIVSANFPRYDCPLTAEKLVLNGVPLKLAAQPDGDCAFFVQNELKGIASKDADGGISIKTRF
jgi:tRNA pseudouridine55 synthase